MSPNYSKDATNTTLSSSHSHLFIALLLADLLAAALALCILRQLVGLARWGLAVLGQTLFDCLEGGQG